MMKREEGQSAVEFAIVLPILLLVVCGIIDFGWLFYNQLSLENSCREGARLACVNCTDPTLQSLVDAKVKGTIPDNLKSSTVVTVQLTTPADPLTGDVTVLVEAKMRTLTPVLGTVYGSTKTISYSVLMKTES